jgi:hypothetical protein
MLVFYIPLCWKTFMSLLNVKCQHGQGTKCSSINKGLFISQYCNFPDESFTLISFCNSVILIWSLFGLYMSLCGPHIILHSSEIRMLALPDPGPCLVPMLSYLSSPIMVPMCFLCDPFEVLALSILVHQWSARSLLRDSYKVPDRS